MDIKDTLRFEYGEICRSIHTIDDFRAKLLALLPIASGAGISLLLDKKIESLNTLHIVVIGILGFLVTLGLFFYELRGIDVCNTLIKRGQLLERELELKGCQFINRPLHRWGFIGMETAGMVVYPAVLGAWLYLVIVGLCSR